MGLEGRALALVADERLRFLTAWSRCVVEGVVVAGDGSIAEGGPSWNILRLLVFVPKTGGRGPVRVERDLVVPLSKPGFAA